MNNVIPFPMKPSKPTMEELLWQARTTLYFKDNQYKLARSWQFEIMPNINKNHQK